MSNCIKVPKLSSFVYCCALAVLINATLLSGGVSVLAKSVADVVLTPVTERHLSGKCHGKFLYFFRISYKKLCRSGLATASDFLKPLAERVASTAFWLAIASVVLMVLFTLWHRKTSPKQNRKTPPTHKRA